MVRILRSCKIDLCKVDFMKGQYFSFDAIIAAVIFMMALVALLSYWYSVRSSLEYQDDQLSRESIRLSNLLFTPPSPNSNCNTITRFGFALSWEDRRINSSLVNCALTKVSQDSNWLKSSLGSTYDVSIAITKVGSPQRVLATIGVPAPSDATNVVKMRRLASLFNETSNESYLVALDLTLYK